MSGADYAAATDQLIASRGAGRPAYSRQQSQMLRISARLRPHLLHRAAVHD